MMRILIADDDFLVRANLRYMIESSEACQKEGILVAGDAANGREALEAVRKLSPDIVISDVRMPQMDGLELQTAIANEYDNISMVMLSGYDDLDSVRRALKNGACDYILKHELNKELIEELLIGIKSRNRQHSPKAYPFAEGQDVLKHDFIVRLLTGYYQDRNQIESRIKVLELDLDMHSMEVVLMQIRMQNAYVADKYLLEFSIQNIVDEILHDYHSGICAHISDDIYAFIICFGDICSTQQKSELRSEIRDRIKRCLNNYINISVSFYEGSPAASISDVTASYQQAEQNYKMRFTPNQKNTGDSKEFDVFAVFDANREQALVNAIRQNEFSSCGEIVHDIFSEIKQYQLTAEVLQNFFRDLLSTLNRVWVEKEINLSDHYHNNVNQIFNSFQNLDEAEKWFLSLLKEAGRQPAAIRNIPDSPYVEQAVSYIHRHYAENISQSIVADSVGISAAYLSRLFRENLKQRFSDYLCAYRISKAEELLRNGNVCNKKIAALCGFNDDAYFARSFKKYTGITPKEYKSTYRQNTGKPDGKH